MRRNGAAALRALVQMRRVPAICGFARAQPHLRSFAFWDSHVSGYESMFCPKYKCGHEIRNP
jgi:hypothetical protein